MLSQCPSPSHLNSVPRTLAAWQGDGANLLRNLERREEMFRTGCWARDERDALDEVKRIIETKPECLACFCRRRSERSQHSAEDRRNRAFPRRVS